MFVELFVCTCICVLVSLYVCKWLCEMQEYKKMRMSKLIWKCLYMCIWEYEYMCKCGYV